MMTELIAIGFLTIVLRGQYQQVEPFADQSVSQELRKKLSPEENLPTSDHSRLEEYVIIAYNSVYIAIEDMEITKVKWVLSNVSAYDLTFMSKCLWLSKKT